MTFELLKPDSLSEAVELVARQRDRARILGGGTDLIVQIKKGAVEPEILISLEKVAELNFISREENGLNIGTMVTAASIQKAELIQTSAPVLAQAAATLGNPLIRRTATIGGNLCNASPSADFAPALLVLDARVRIVNAHGNRVVNLEDFFVGPRHTILSAEDILARIMVPPMPPHSRAVYLKSTRSCGADLAQVGVAVMVTTDGPVIRDIRIALGAVAPTPIRARKIEEVLTGRRWNDEMLEDVCEMVCDEASCISDVRCSASHRDKLINVLTGRAVYQAAQPA
jgi:CO/xanthine dehydrogenase FAD-binding subunit